MVSKKRKRKKPKEKLRNPKRLKSLKVLEERTPNNFLRNFMKKILLKLWLPQLLKRSWENITQ